MKKDFETVFILNPVLSEDQMKDTVDRFVGIVKDKGGEIINVEHWGLRKLAYPIERKSTGFYNLVEFKTPPETIDALETEFRRDEAVMRFLTVSLDKWALEYNAKRRKGEFKKNKPKEEAAS
ncbi:MAG: 30S ribosomal protein S6 [Bacteroidota bacterium]